MKNCFLKLFFCFFILVNTTIRAQYTDVINSNKPGFSESPYSVGLGVYQLESNFFFRNTNVKTTFSQPQSYGVDLLFRTSFFMEKLELNMQLAYQKDKVVFKNIFSSHHFVSGLGKFTVGAKYLLFEPEYEDKTKEVRSWKRRNAFDKKRLIPSVAIYLGANTDFVSKVHKTGQISPKVGVLLQHNLTDKLNIVSNAFYDKIGTDFSEISYIITATQNFERWSGFLEVQGIFEEYQKSTNLGVGLAYLFSRNLQINSSVRYLMEGDGPGFYGGLGVSYRINKHKDPYSLLDDNGNKIKDTPIDNHNKRRGGFFSRILNIFKKKEN